MDFCQIIICVVVAIYLSIAVTMNIISISDVGAIWILIPVFLVILWMIIYVVMYQQAGNLLTIRKGICDYSQINRISIICGGIIFLGQILYWLAYYPGGFNLDAYGQWD